MSAFTISSDRNGVQATVRCTGELDLVSAGEAEGHLRALEATGIERIVLDLRPLEFLDSTGLRIILAADARARRRGRRLVIVPGPESVHRVFRVALLDRRLEFVPPPDEGDADA